MENSPVVLKHLIDRFRDKLGTLYPASEIMQFVYFLAEEHLAFTRASVHASYNAVLSAPVIGHFEAALNRLAAGEPVQYILGKTEFAGLIFKVDHNVLIPRPETEELFHLIKHENSGKAYAEFSILDIGTGSGCIAVSLKVAFPHSRVTAIDKMEGALNLAEENAMLHAANITFIKSDILDETAWEATGQFDVIVSNPPYVTDSEKGLMHRNVVGYEPPEALFVPDEDPLVFYRSIAAFAWRRLTRPGILYLEVNERFGQDVKRMLEISGFEKVNVVRDMHDRERFVRAEARIAMLDTSYWYADKQ